MGIGISAKKRPVAMLIDVLKTPTFLKTVRLIHFAFLETVVNCDKSAQGLYDHTRQVLVVVSCSPSRLALENTER